MNFQSLWNSALETVANYGPKLGAALAILVGAFIVGKILAYAARYVINRAGIGDGVTLGNAIGKALFWLTMLIALPAVLGALDMDGLLKPMQDMSAKFLGFLPNLVGAGLIFGIGFMIAKVVREALTSVLQAAQIDKHAERLGLTGLGADPATTTGSSVNKIDTSISSMETKSTGLAGMLGTLVFTLLIIPVAIAALDALAIESISTPAKQMLQSVLDAIPNIFAAAIVLGLSVLIGRFASQTLVRVLPATGIDSVGDRLGLANELSGETSVSKIAGSLAFAAIVIFGLIEAAKLLDFAIVSNIMTQILELGGRVLLGSMIIGFGVIAADFIADIVARSKDAKGMSNVIRVAIIILASAMGLRQMGLANEIINTGFTLMIGALALGTAIAIGMGGKDTASRLLEKWTKDV